MKKLGICSDNNILLHGFWLNFWYNKSRLHAQALTLAALAGAAVVEYYDHKAGAKADKYAGYIPYKDFK